MALPTQRIAQLASFRMKLGADQPIDDARDVVGTRPLQIDRLQARIIVEPSGTGTVPAPADVRAMERLLRFRLALDRNDRRVFTLGDIPLDALQQLDGGPVPVPPFTLNVGEQPKVRLSVPPNFFLAPIFTGFGQVWVEFLFWGVEL
jgi:hypothetical protein